MTANRRLVTIAGRSVGFYEQCVGGTIVFRLRKNTLRSLYSLSTKYYKMLQRIVRIILIFILFHPKTHYFSRTIISKSSVKFAAVFYAGGIEEIYSQKKRICERKETVILLELFS